MEPARATRADLFDPASLAALGHIEIIARWIVEASSPGFTAPRARGSRSSSRSIVPINLATICATSTGRSPRAPIDGSSQYEEETNLRASVVLDVSRSMAWSGAQMRIGPNARAGRRLTKLAYAERLTAAMALLLLRQRDAVGLMRFDDHIRNAVPPRARNGQWRRIVAALRGTRHRQSVERARGAAQAARLITRRGLIVLISDLLMDPPDVERAMRALRAAGHDVIVLHVMDPAERELPSSGEALFVDPESDSRSRQHRRRARGLSQHRRRSRSVNGGRCSERSGIGYEVVSTDAPFGVPLRRAFAARQQLP